VARTIKIKKNDIPKDIEGCRLIPLDKGKPHFPKAQDNVLPNTYYRVPNDDENRLRCFVTVMPDGNRIAWDTCGKCKTHVSHCSCPSGVYHPSSIGWIRATCDVNYPTERVTDYSKYNDPYKRYSGEGVDRWAESVGRKPTDPKSYKAVTRKQDAEVPVVKSEVPVVKSEGPELTLAEIENIDLAELGKQATKQAKRTVRRARSVIKGGK
jgi:hypothetical protein